MNTNATDDVAKKKLKLLLVDFDGVLSDGRFYRVPDPAQDEIGRAAVDIIFSRDNHERVRSWMRGELTYGDVHDYVERRIGTDARLLDGILKESVKYMPLNPSLLRFVTSLRSRGVTVSLFTDNMDIFDIVSRQYHALDDHFDRVYSSSSHGQLKLESNALLYKAASDAAATLDEIVLVDDSRESFVTAKNYGVDVFLYEQYEASQLVFERWLEHHYDY